VSDQSSLGLLVKNIQLPNYTLDTETLNQYNRKRVIQKKINYLPVSMIFHDDGGYLSRNLWYNYYTYYYKDSTYGYDNIPNQSGTSGRNALMQNGFGYGTSDTYSGRQNTDWGFIGEGFTDTSAGTASGNNNGKPRFFNDITIYGHDVELYAQDQNTPYTEGQGVYSVKRNKWIVKPKQQQIDLKDPALQQKVDQYIEKIDTLINSNAEEKTFEDLKKKFVEMRKSAIKQGGEFSLENLVFKELRNLGYLEKVDTYLRTRQDERLSLE
jgi:hypothetical protein